MTKTTSSPKPKSAKPRAREPLVEDLEARLNVAEDTIRAIYDGEVDAVIVKGPAGPQVYTLEGSDLPYRVLVEQMHEGTVTLDPSGLILYSNRQFASMMGTDASVTGARFAQFLSETDSDLFLEAVEIATSRGYSSRELKLKAADGELVPVRLSMTLLDTGGSRTVCVVATDLREEYRNEAILKEEQLSRLILEQAGEGIVVIDPQGIIVRRSESARILAGKTIFLTHFDRAFRLTTEGSTLSAQNILSSVSAGDHLRGLEATMLRRDGHHYSLLVSTSPLWSESKVLLGCVVTLTDITERKRVEQALALKSNELQRSNDDLRQFAYSASHDLREPMRQVALFAELLQKKFSNQFGDEGNVLIEHTVDSARRMEDLLKGLLTYIQAVDGPQQPDVSADANRVVGKILRTFDAEISECGARILCDALPVLRMHEAHLTQLFQNLISNALKYRGEAPPLIRIEAERASEMWKISVSDNGIGIPAHYHEQVFRLFQRLHGGGRYAGSGIGLAICQKIVQRYGGQIGVESEAGMTRFVFTLPGENYES